MIADITIEINIERVLEQESCLKRQGKNNRRMVFRRRPVWQAPAMTNPWGCIAFLNTGSVHLNPETEPFQ